MRADPRFPDGEDFARFLWNEYLTALRQMKLMSENATKLPAGIVGMGIQIGDFEIPATPEFLKLAEPFKEPCGKEEAFSIVMPSELEPALGTFCRVHCHLEDGKLTKFYARLQRKTPQKEYKSNPLGAFPYSFFKIVASLGEPQVTAATILRGFILDQKMWPLRPEFAARPTDFTPEIVSEKLELTHDKGGIELIFHKEDAQVFFEVTGTATVKLDPTCFDVACEQMWPHLKSVFQENAPHTATA
jgi:hypothetical protein